jgi:uncharacterized coiled-coil protein SlyX
MQRVNAAYQDLDLPVLRSLAREADDGVVAARSIEERLAWAKREVERLDAMLAGQEAELASLRSTETFALWERAQAGQAPVAGLQAELSRARHRLARMERTLRRLVERRKAKAASSDLVASGSPPHEG